MTAFVIGTMAGVICALLLGAPVMVGLLAGAFGSLIGIGIYGVAHR